jgi:hypothetical protein
MEPRKYDHFKWLVKLTMITLSDYHRKTKLIIALFETTVFYMNAKQINT